MLHPERRTLFEEKLGYRFDDEKRLIEALTHASARGDNKRMPDNERLEFLGDRVLGLVIADRLGQIFPHANEGELAKRFNLMVRMETCADVAKIWKLGDVVIVGQSEMRNGVCEKPTILANACEAVIGAVYLDGGYRAAKTVVLKVWAPMLEIEPKQLIDPKSGLQEWAQGLQLPLPRYRVKHQSGPDHNPEFFAEVVIENYDPATGSGQSKRLAEQEAARTFLLREGIWRDERN